jgi:hypothetical protein
MPDSDVDHLLYDHVLGSGSPCSDLIERGEFPPGWVDRYLDLVGSLSDHYAGQSMLPRRAIWAVHFASWYLPLRYEVWHKSSGRTNQVTIGELGRIRTPSEVFIYGLAHEAGD